MTTPKSLSASRAGRSDYPRERLAPRARPRCPSLSLPKVRTLSSRSTKTRSPDPGTLLPHPLRAWIIKVRNVETLRRLAFIAEHRAVD